MHTRPRCALMALWLAGWVIPVTGGSGCVSGSKIRADAALVQEDIKRARTNGAYKCAPRELAMAETQVEFALDELDQGNWLKAEEHAQIAIASVKAALENSPADQCGPKRVLVKETPQIVVAKADRDGDGVPDIEDDCPDQPGPAELKGCPPPLDSDGDGILDTVDKCPSDPEDKDGFQDQDGCPDFDNDQDGIPDLEDACPNEPGVAENRGCPVTDRDKDGIPDDLDKCPDEPGPPETQGCPRKFSLVRIDREKKQIEIKQKIFFETAKWKILPKSFGLLNEVAQALRDFPSMKVSIEGHTDSQGADEYNQKLSENRAGAVREYLINQGVVAERLESHGFGESKPIASNRTPRGREANRRVEFRIVSE